MNLRTFLLLCVLFTFSEVIFAQLPYTAELQSASWLYIDGNSNIVPYKLKQNGKAFATKCISFTVYQFQNKIYISQNEINVKVRSFNSENKIALQEFLKLIKSESYPNIVVGVKYIDLASSFENNRLLKANAFVDFNISGVKVGYIIPVTIIQKTDLIIVDGVKEIDIHDFGLEPPNKILGLVKVSEWITVSFHLIIKLSELKTQTLSF